MHLFARVRFLWGDSNRKLKVALNPLHRITQRGCVIPTEKLKPSQESRVDIENARVTFLGGGDWGYFF